MKYLYKVEYPSGKMFTLNKNCRLKITMLGDKTHPPFLVVVVQTGIGHAPILCLDPRCIITAKDGTVVYQPRKHMAAQQPGMREWLTENPEWAKL